MPLLPLPLREGVGGLAADLLRHSGSRGCGVWYGHGTHQHLEGSMIPVVRCRGPANCGVSSYQELRIPTPSLRSLVTATHQQQMSCSERFRKL
jgi:hypothetical protein